MEEEALAITGRTIIRTIAVTAMEEEALAVEETTVITTRLLLLEAK
jgi:hypothetical protein